MGFLLFADFMDEWLGWLVAGLLPDVRGHFHLDYAKAGWVLMAHHTGGYIGSALSGVAADLYNRRRLLLLGTALYAFGLTLAGAATSYGVLLAACVCIGLASGPVAHTARLILIDRARKAEERLEKTLGCYNALGSVGDLLGPLSLAMSLSAGLGWRCAFCAGALFMAAYGLGLGVMHRGSRSPTLARDKETRGWSHIVETAKDGRLLRLALALALLDGLDEPFAGFVILHLRDVAGVSGASANAVITVLVGSPLVGFALAARTPWSRHRMIRASLLILGAAVAGFLLASGIAAKALCLAFVGTSTAVFYTSALAASFSLRPNATGTVTSVLSMVGALSLLLPPFVGSVADACDLSHAMLVYVALPFAMLMLVTGIGRSEEST
ncbi:MAG: MFS transporter [Vicinamibacteria bacterium]|nr:MFS transporter [Vicinamibacteria bacterium]